MIAQMDQDGDKMLSQNEFQIPGARFEDADANKDGLVDLKELTALLESNRGRPFGPPSGAEMADGILDRFDRNGDGKLTKEELQELPEGLWQKWDLNADGVVEAGELEKALENTRGGLGPIMNPPRGPRPAGPPGAGPRGELLRGNPADIIKKQDQDGDGKLTAAELGVDAKTFQRIDRDGDGKITAEELATAQDLIRPQTPELRNNLREHRRPGNEGKR
jgi:Ca2+-binding EF-hand superfamily protein